MLYKWDIVGHEAQLQALEEEIKSGNLSHAYLFAGPEKVGKFTVAKTLAHILQCSNNFCHQCPVCKQIEKGIHSDTIQMKDDGESIKIEQVRNLINRLNMTTNSNYKVFLAENIERMMHEAANALLKTLEDPPPKTIFICTTTNVREILPTIVSRMRVYRFNSLSDQALEKAVGELFPEVEPETLKQVCALSMGQPGKAFKLLRDPGLMSHFKQVYNDVLRLLQGDNIAERFSYVAGICEDPQAIHDFLDILLHVLRVQLLSNANADLQKSIEAVAAAQQAAVLMKKNVNTKLALENLMLSV